MTEDYVEEQPNPTSSESREPFDDEELPPILYKYRSWSEPLHRRILEQREVFFAPPGSFNDPFDCKPAFDRAPDQRRVREMAKRTTKREFPDLPRRERRAIEKDYRKNAKGRMRTPGSRRCALEDSRARLNEHFGVLCLSEEQHSILLWSLYADSHKGFCVGLDSSLLYKAVEKSAFMTHRAFLHACAVDYGNNRAPFSLKSDMTHGQRQVEFEQTFKRKHSGWSFEQEHRIILFSDTRAPLTAEQRTYQVPPECIVSVYMGCRMEEEHKEELRKAVISANRKVKLYQAKERMDVFGLSFSEVS